MDPHYHIVSVQDASYEAVAPPSYEYSAATHAYSRTDDTYAQSTGQTYDGLLTTAAVPPASYPSYPSSAQAMEYVQSMYQMQIAQEMAVNGFPDNHPGYASRGLVSSDGRRKRRRIITHEQRKAANIRERRRMFHLNEAFDQLRKRVPTFAYEKKLSRIETLKLAVTYIKFMGDLVTELGGEPTTLDLSSGSQGETEEVSQNTPQQQGPVKQEDSAVSSSSGEEEEEE